jgi:hypothetical protein
MPVTTTEARAIAARMSSISNVGGNMQVLRQIAYEDSAQLDELRQQVQGSASPPAGMVASLVVAHSRTVSAVAYEGNVALHPLIIASAADVVAAADFLDTPPPEPPPEEEP